MSNHAPTPQPAGALEFECINPQCSRPPGRKLTTPAPQPELLNGLNTSAVIYSHERGVSCNYCNAYYVIGIAGVQAAINWGIQPAERPTGLVLAGPGRLPT